LKVYQFSYPSYGRSPRSMRFYFKAVLSIVLLIGLLLPAKSVKAQQKTVFLPMISTAGPEDLRSADSASLSSCADLNSEETAFALEFLTDSGQKRPLVNCNPTLSAVARARAKDMAVRAYFGHVNPDGIGPDKLVERAGYKFPEWYPVTNTSNHIESIAYGTSYTTAELAWDALMDSSSHRKHLRGLTEFFAGQSEFGIGHSYANRRHYWVISSAHPAQ